MTTREADMNVNKDETALIECSTTAGSFKMKLIREWSPFGYDRAVYLFQHGFYDTSHFFRTVPGFLVQFGIRLVLFDHIGNISSLPASMSKLFYSLFPFPP